MGLDLSKKSAVIFAAYAGVREIKPAQQKFLDELNKEFRMIHPDLDEFVRLSKAVKDHEVHVLIENSTQTFDVYWMLTNLGLNVTVAQSQDLYRITKSVKKTDSNDSVELANYMRRRLAGEDEFAVCVMPPKEWMYRREMCRVVFDEKVHLADLKRRVRSHMLLHGIKLSKDYREIFSPYAIRELKNTKDPVLLCHVAEAESIKKRTDQEVKYIETMFESVRIYELIHSIPGFGCISAAYLASMIIDIDRFESCKKFTANFGVVPRMYQSGDTNRNCHVTHRGDADAIRLLKQAAFVHVNTVENSVVTQMYNRLRAKGKSFNEVKMACARKLLTVVWSVLKNDKSYTSPMELQRKASDLADEMLEDMEQELPILG